MNVAAYLRMSSDQQDKSLAEQRAEIIAYAAKHGYKIVAWYTDEAISGWKSKERRDFQKLIDDAQNGTFKGVLCWDQERFSRFDPMTANHFWYLLREAGVFLETVCNGRLDWDTLGGWLTASVSQHGKAEYCRSLAHNVTRGRRASVLAGNWISPAPFGYKTVGGKLSPSEDAPIVKRIYRMRAKGMGRPAICKALNSEGVPSPKGRTWSARQLYFLLTKQTYLGHTVIGSKRTGKFAHLLDEERVIENTHPAIIDADLWERVQAVNSNRTNTHPNRGGKKLGGPLSGLLVCAKCGATMFFEKRWQRYICSTYHQGQGCANHTIKNSVAMKLVASKVRELVLLGSPKALAAHIASLRRKPPPNLQKQVDDLDRKLAAAAERLLDVEPESVPAVRDAMRKLQERRKAIAGQLSPKPEKSAETIAAGIWTLNDALASRDVQKVRTALAQVVERVVLTFGQNPKDKRKWLPIGGTVFFFRYQYGKALPGEIAHIGSEQSPLFPGDFS